MARINIAVIAILIALVGYFAFAWYDSEQAHFEREQVVLDKWHECQLVRQILVLQAKNTARSEFLKLLAQIRERNRPTVPIVEEGNEIRYEGIRFRFHGGQLESISSDDDQFFQP